MLPRSLMSPINLKRKGGYNKVKKKGKRSKEESCVHTCDTSLLCLEESDNACGT